MLKVKFLSSLILTLYTSALVGAIEAPKSAWTPSEVTALLVAVFAGLGILITAMTGLIIAVMKLRSSTHEIRAKAEDIHAAVNGANRALLMRVDRLTSRVADFTGRPIDIEESEAAHAEVVANAELPQNKEKREIG